MRTFPPLRPALGLAASLLLLLPFAAVAHSGSQPSVHDTVAGILDRLKRSADSRTIQRLDRRGAEGLLTAEEKALLASAHLSFHVDRPVTVAVFRDTSLDKEPFWLREGGWHKQEGSLKVGDVTFDIWQKRFEAGDVGLGVNSLRGGGRHYFAAVAAEDGGPVDITDLYPGQLRTTNFIPGALPWVDRTDSLQTVPEGWSGRLLVQTLHARRDDAKLAGRVRWTQHPSSARPDHVVLTWSGDPRTTQAIQWRTDRTRRRGAVVYTEASRASRPFREWQRADAVTEALTSATTVNNPVVHRHTVELAHLRPDTTYVYRVGSGDGRDWSGPREFTTAPGAPEPFSFIYMGDAQNGLDTWGKLVRGAHRARPDAAFYLMAGDLVDRGNERDDWDMFFENARGVFDRRPIVPVIGNHECQGGHPTHYLRQFALPRNGPTGIEAERAYALEYGNALFIVLDSNLPPESQTAWLEAQLAGSRARWKFVAYHHPAYSSAAGRDNKKLRELWTPIFDRHGVDLALQGHDHAYLRTHPLRGGQAVADTASGTTYIVSVSGTKLYKQDKSQPTTAVGFTDIPTWQILDLEIAGDRLTYRAYDRQGRIRDEFVIDKSR